jgi:hypothetical protein
MIYFLTKKINEMQYATKAKQVSNSICLHSTQVSSLKKQTLGTFSFQN